MTNVEDFTDEHLFKIARMVAAKLLNTYTADVFDFDEALSITLLTVIQANNMFDPTKNPNRDAYVFNKTYLLGVDALRKQKTIIKKEQIGRVPNIFTETRINSTRPTTLPSIVTYAVDETAEEPSLERFHELLNVCFLNEYQRHLMTQRYYHDYKIKDMAKADNCAASSMCKKVKEVLKKCEGYLKDREDEMMESYSYSAPAFRSTTYI